MPVAVRSLCTYYTNKLCALTYVFNTEKIQKENV